MGIFHVFVYLSVMGRNAHIFKTTTQKKTQCIIYLLFLLFSKIKMEGEGRFPPSKLGDFNTPSKLRLRCYEISSKIHLFLITLNIYWNEREIKTTSDFLYPHKNYLLFKWFQVKIFKVENCVLSHNLLAPGWGSHNEKEER